jgi:hypothetical protein
MYNIATGSLPPKKSLKKVSDSIGSASESGEAEAESREGCGLDGDGTGHVGGHLSREDSGGCHRRVSGLSSEDDPVDA